MRTMIRTLAPALLATLAVAGCGGHAATPPGSQPSSAAVAATTPAEPETAAGAVAAAQQVFELYAAQQWAAVYPDMIPSIRAAVSEQVFAAVHQQCSGTAAGLSYQVTSPVLAGSTAVVTVSLAGAASGLASESQTFQYDGGKWLWGLTPQDAAQWAQGGTAAAIVSRLKGAGYCG